MHNKLTSLLLFSLFFAAGCAGTGSSQPDWVNGNSSLYLPSKYLSGKGQDGHQAVARDRARADLTKIFEVRIQEQSEDQVRSNSKTEAGKTRLQLESSTSRNISTHSDQIISGIQIAETWEDKANKQFHVLAVLERMKASANLRDSINQLDEVTALAIRRARQNNNLLPKIGLAHRALQAQLEREVYAKQLKIVDYSGRGLDSPYNLATLANDRDALLQRMSIYSKVDTDPLGGLDTMLKAAISAAGFTHVTDTKKAYILEAKLILNERKDAQGWYWQRGTLEISLIHASSQQVQGSQRWDIKESSQDQTIAKKRVNDTIDKILKSQLRSTIISFGTNDPS
ncbi:hypothetical protein MNBD_GAMMA25-230 [hydrothermal vent metagenome]|uniref:Lipoprotein LPP20-like domain-containing protein n=1 Tax=hydrothermal vent metagenome TaxID=652676 RepID=A0A3B1AVF3_9ZZZZ